MPKQYDHQPTVSKDKLLESVDGGQTYESKPVETWCCPSHRLAVIRGEIPRSGVAVEPKD